MRPAPATSPDTIIIIYNRQNSCWKGLVKSLVIITRSYSTRWHVNNVVPTFLFLFLFLFSHFTPPPPSPTPPFFFFFFFPFSHFSPPPPPFHTYACVIYTLCDSRRWLELAKQLRPEIRPTVLSPRGETVRARARRSSLSSTIY